MQNEAAVAAIPESPSVSSGRKVSRLELGRELFALAGEQGQVASHRHDQAAQRQPVPRVGLDRGQDARGLARLLDALDRVFDGRPRFGMRKVSQMAEVRGEIARTDEQAVHAFYGGDGLEV